jgi:DnaJ-domain-containing protein 1
MTDCFALFSQPRRPWLELEELKTKFHAMAAVQHPDARASGDANGFAALNAAYATLRDPALRLSHLLALEERAASAGTPAIPSDLADSFMAIAELRRALRDLRQRQRGGGSKVVRAVFADEKRELEGKSLGLLEALEVEHARAMNDLRDLDAVWPTRDAALIARAVALQHRLAYLGRWIADLREELLEMTLS